VIAPIGFEADYFLRAHHGIASLITDPLFCPIISTIGHWVLFITNPSFRYNGTTYPYPGVTNVPQPEDYWSYGKQQVKFSPTVTKLIQYEAPVPSRIDVDGRIIERVNVHHPDLGDGSASIDITYPTEGGPGYRVRAYWTFPGTYPLFN